MKTRLFIPMLLWALVASTALQAQNAGKKWSLSEAVAYGIENNISVQQSQLQVSSSQSTYRQSRESRLPNVNGSGTQTLRTGRSIDPFTNQLREQSINSTSFGVDASVTLWNGFRINNTIKQNELNYRASQLDVEQAKRDVSLNIATGYLQVLLAKELLSASQQQSLATKNQIERTEKLLAAGSVAENQLIDLKAQLANDEVNVITAENQLSIAKLNLMQQMNLPATSEFDVQDVEVGLLTNDYEQQSPQQIYDVAVNNQFDIKSAEMRIQSSSYSKEVARAGLMPSLSLGAGISSFYSDAAPDQRFSADGTFTTQQVPVGFLANDPTQLVVREQQVPNGTLVDNGFRSQVDFNRSTYVALRLNIPIYNNGQVRNSIQQAEINKKSAEYTAQSRRIQVRQNVEQAYNDMKTTSKSYEARRKQVESLELAFQNTEKRFNVGAANAVDYNLAKINLDRANAELIRAKYDYLFRIKVLDFYLNKPLDL